MITNLILLVLLSNAAAKPFIRTTRNNIFAFQSKQAPTVTAPLSKNDFFTIIEDPKKRGATVLEAPVEQEGVKLYIAIDSASFQNKDRPGNGGIRLLSYQSKEHAIDDAVRLAKGMTRKHDMFRTGFSGAKVVIDHDHEDLSVVKRDTLMRDAAKALKALDGSMYTGCDLNTSDEDMDFLTKFTDDKYVLAGRNSRVDTNAATASSVIGSILGVLDVNNEIISELTFTVQGCGKVGSIVARELLRYGAKCVQTCDLFSENAEIPGCVPIDDWTKSTCDFFVPCANSLAITETVANNFPEGVKYCVGAANSPYANERARSVFDERGVLHVPESISSAGAILADSVEWYDIDLYQTVERSLMYGWIRDISRTKSSSLVRKADKKATNIGTVLRAVVPPRIGDPIGKEFPEWIKKNTVETDTVIVGGGVAGTAAAFALSEKGENSVIVERGSSIAPATASSNGDSRMYRRMYSSEFFSKMQSKALNRWKDVEEKSGETLLKENGLLFYGEDTGETVEGSVLGAKEIMDKLNLPYTFYASGDEIAARYPSLAGCKGKPYSGVCEDTAGHIRASKACEAMVKAAGQHCDVRVNSKITSLDVKEDKVTAITENGETIIGKKAVIAAGPWTNEVLSMAQLPQVKLSIWMVQWAHYEVDRKVAESIPQAFHFRKENDIDGGLYYVFPATATEAVTSTDSTKSYVKVGVDYPTNEALGDMKKFSYEGEQEVLDLMDGWVKEHLPAIGKRIDSYCSPYTMTDDSYFVMDTVRPNVAIFSGGSGRAFKFGPLLGDCMVSLLNNDDAPIDLAPFSLGREALKM